jgi:hypothetical protein
MELGAAGMFGTGSTWGTGDRLGARGPGREPGTAFGAVSTFPGSTRSLLGRPRALRTTVASVSPAAQRQMLSPGQNAVTSGRVWFLQVARPFAGLRLVAGPAFTRGWRTVSRLAGDPVDDQTGEP